MYRFVYTERAGGMEHSLVGSLVEEGDSYYIVRHKEDTTESTMLPIHRVIEVNEVIA